MTLEDGGWISTAILALAGIIKGIFDYQKKKSDNETSVKITESDRYKQSREELEKTNKELMGKLSSIEDSLSNTKHKLDKALSAFEIIFPLIETMIKDKPEYQKTFETALKHFKDVEGK